MSKQLDTVLGFYSPSFMRLHINTRLNLMNLNTLNDDFTESVYLHEYTHFIQDISTTYGLANICAIVDYMRFVNNHVISLPTKSFSTPVKPTPLTPNNVHANLEFQKLYFGGGRDSRVTLTKHYLTNKMVSTQSGNKPLDVVAVDYTTYSGGGTFEFGALCVMESMAYLTQRLCYSNSPQSPDLPYSSAELLIDLIYPSFGLDKLNVLALCDASLKSFHPGWCFYNMLLQMQKQNATFSAPEDVYQYVDINHPPFNFGGATNLTALLQQMSSNAISQVTGYFNHAHFYPVRDWLTNMIDSAVKYRLADDSFPLKIARGGKINSNAALAGFKTSVGTPLVTNNLHDAILYDARQSAAQPDYTLIWAIDEIHSTFFWNQKECGMKGFCTKQREGFFPICKCDKPKVDSRCETTPWKRSGDKKLCAYAQVWRHWGLMGCEIV